MVHHYLASYSLGESVLYVHADNCVGQNKNNLIMQYLCWRVLAGLNKVIKIMFLPVGHTKFSPDAGFGMIKSKFRRTQVCSTSELCECIVNSTPSSKVNRAQLVGTEQGMVHVPTYDWQSKFKAMQFKTIPCIKDHHHFVFSSAQPGTVAYKDCDTDPEVLFIMTDCKSVSSSVLPDTIAPSGLSPERQWYLYESIRPLVPEYAKDTICPRPSCDKKTFAEVHAAATKAAISVKESSRQKVKARKTKQTECESDQDEDEELELPAARRKPQTCSYCSQQGHINRKIR